MPELAASFESMDLGVIVTASNAIQRSGHDMSTPEMVFAPKILLYTHEILLDHEEILEVFAAAGFRLEIVNAGSRYHSVFISYGGPDEALVSKLNDQLRERSVRTWFFPVDAVPGEKLHRSMFDGVNEYDRVLLVCSRASLTRPGVLNELERVLEREAKLGGVNLVIPVTLDDFVFDEWSPSRADLASQIRSRVIINLDLLSVSEATRSVEFERLLMSLERNRAT